MNNLKLHIKTIISIILIVFLANCKTSQVAKNNELERFYNQGHYKVVVRKAKNNIENDKLKNKSVFYLYKAVSLAKLAEDKRYLNSNPDALKESVKAYEKYYKTLNNKKVDKNQSNLLSELKSIYKKTGSISISSNAYAFLMDKKETNLVSKNTSTPKKQQIPTKIVLKGDKKDTLVKDKNLSKEEQMIEYAKKFIGVPYQYGGTGDGGFDCSGYTQYIYSRYGKTIPRSARYQEGKLKKIPLKNAKKGDLIFFSKNRKTISHVGIVISEKGEDLTMIHASSSRGIMITNVSTNSYWKPKLMSAGRL